MSLAQLLADYFDRAKSHIYGIFIFWMAAFHSKIIFVSIFVDQKLIYDKTGLLKNEYISDRFLNINNPGFWWAEFLFLALSVLLTFLMIWILPRTLIKKAYSREIEDQFERENMKLTKEAEMNKKKELLLKTEEAIVVKEEKIADKKVNLETRETRAWMRDYQDFKASAEFRQFNYVIEAVYEHAGQTKVENEYGGIEFQVPARILAWVDSLGLVQFNGAQEKITITDKGRYFLKRFQEDSRPKG